MKTPIQVLLEVAKAGGQLAIVGEKLRTRLPNNCSAELKASLRQEKVALISLLKLEFVVVSSELLELTLFWTSDSATREKLIMAGAEPRAIYARSELAILVTRNVSPVELPLINTAKRLFMGRIKDP